MRIINQTPLELFVKEYIRQHKFRKTVQELNFYRKALGYVLQKIDTTCCNPDDPTILLYTDKDNLLSSTVFRLLLQMRRSGNVKSLERTRDMLEAVIVDPCCSVTGQATLNEENLIIVSQNPQISFVLNLYCDDAILYDNFGIFHDFGTFPTIAAMYEWLVAYLNYDVGTLAFVYENGGVYVNITSITNSPLCYGQGLTFTIDVSNN